MKKKWNFSITDKVEEKNKWYKITTKQQYKQQIFYNLLDRYVLYRKTNKQDYEDETEFQAWQT